MSREWYSSAVNGDCVSDELEQTVAVQRRTRSVAPACVVLYLAVVLGLLVTILHRDDGVFTYTLDDPYIHLALAQNIAHGHYGINLGEASSPSSSILWPFLLTPFAGSSWGMYLPLAWNLFFCAMAAWLIGRIVDGWQWGLSMQPPAESAAGDGWLEWIVRFAIAAALMLVANLAGLTFVGMEHGLQVLLAIACAAGMVEAFAGRRIPTWCLVAAALGPMVRYENFALLAAMAVVLCGQGRVRTAIKLVGISLVGPVLFSCFLLSRGLPMLPSSVLVKANLASAHGGTLFAVLRSLYGVAVKEGAWWGQIAITLLLICLMLREKQPLRRYVLGGALLAAFLHLGFGRSYWFHRYEVYALIFTTLVVSSALAEWMAETKLIWPWRSALLAGLVALGAPYAMALWQTPAAASNVYQQQYQMHRFVAEFYRNTVAVNDLGWVSYRRPTGLYVLDLWGLASPEASRQTHKSDAWLDGIVREHGAQLAMIYPDWYDEGSPDDWELLGVMCITSPRTSISQPCVSFYSTQMGDPVALKALLRDFTRTLPVSVTLALN